VGCSTQVSSTIEIRKVLFHGHQKCECLTPFSSTNLRLEENPILEWVSYFGEVKTNLFEDTREEPDDSSDDLPPVENGIYSVKMKLTQDIPQLISNAWKESSS